MATEKRTPEDTARCIARNAIPDVDESLELMKLQGPVQVGDVKDGHGTVLITLRSGDAYEFARWVRTGVARDGAQQTSARSHGDDSIKGPVGYRGSIETPTTIRVGDLILHDHVYFAVADMVSARNGIKILHLQDREPLLVEGPTTIYRRQVAYMVSFGEIVYSRSCPTDSAPAGGPPVLLAGAGKDPAEQSPTGWEEHLEN